MRNKEPQEVKIKGNTLICPVCGGTHYRTRRTLLNTPGVSFLGFDWLNKTAINYICDECDYILWFYDE